MAAGVEIRDTTPKRGASELRLHCRCWWSRLRGSKSCHWTKPSLEGEIVIAFKNRAEAVGGGKRMFWSQTVRALNPSGTNGTELKFNVGLSTARATWRAVSKGTQPRNGRRALTWKHAHTLSLSFSGNETSSSSHCATAKQMNAQILTRAVQTDGLFRGSFATSQQGCARDRCQDYGDATSPWSRSSPRCSPVPGPSAGQKHDPHGAIPLPGHGLDEINGSSSSNKRPPHGLRQPKTSP